MHTATILPVLYVACTWMSHFCLQVWCENCYLTRYLTPNSVINSTSNHRWVGVRFSIFCTQETQRASAATADIFHTIFLMRVDRDQVEEHGGSPFTKCCFKQHGKLGSFHFICLGLAMPILRLDKKDGLNYLQSYDANMQYFPITIPLVERQMVGWWEMDSTFSLI